MKKEQNEFICSLCGKTYEEVRDRIKCESECLHRIELEEKQEKIKIAEEEKKKKLEAIEEQIKFLKDNEQTLYKEYLNTVKLRRENEKKLVQLKYGKEYTPISGFPFDFFLY